MHVGVFFLSGDFIHLPADDHFDELAVLVHRPIGDVFQAQHDPRVASVFRNEAILQGRLGHDGAADFFQHLRRLGDHGRNNVGNVEPLFRALREFHVGDGNHVVGIRHAVKQLLAHFPDAFQHLGGKDIVRLHQYGAEIVVPENGRHIVLGDQQGVPLVKVVGVVRVGLQLLQAVHGERQNQNHEHEKQISAFQDGLAQAHKTLVDCLNVQHRILAAVALPRRAASLETVAYLSPHLRIALVDAV